MENLPRKLFIFGFTILFGTIAIFWVIVPALLHWKIKQMIRLEEGNEIYDAFTNIDADILFKVYLFNVTNSKEVESGKSRPSYEEIGPYVYEEKRQNIPLNINDDTFTYKSTILYKFRPDLSIGSDEDVVTAINVPILAIGNELTKWSSWVVASAKYFLNGFDEPLFVNRKVKTLLFEGVQLELIETVSSILGIEYLPNNTFAYFYEKNATLSAPFEVFTGTKDSSKFGQIKTWNGKGKLDIWNGESCNMVNGSDTSLYPPFVKKSSILRAFDADGCRSIHMVFKTEDSFEGIFGYRFEPPQDFFDPNTYHNKCFCTEEDESNCPQKNGVLSISACRWGAPLLISNPYFLHGDPYYNDHTGLSKGIPELHESYAVLEPNIGAVLVGSRRTQLNIQMRRSKDITSLANVQNAIVPLFWFDEVASQPPNRINQLKNRMVLPLTIIEISKWAMLVITSFITVIGLFIFQIRTKNKKPSQYFRDFH